MSFGWNLDTILSILPCILALAVIYFLLRINWKQYGLLLLISGTAGLALCILFVALEFYSFPFRLFPSAFRFPILTLLLVFPAYIAIAVRYSPHWTLWESYALWWVFMLAFEWLGGLIVSPEKRMPVDSEFLRYGKPGFFIVHAVLIATVFLAGLYIGVKAFTNILQ